MIVTPRFVFLNLHKSGGAFVDDFLMKFVTDARRVGHHLPRKMIPKESAHLPVLGFVRNPWSYYVSWYFFQLERPHPNFLFRILSDNGLLDFNATVRNMLNLGAGSVRLELLLRALPKSYGNQGLNLPATELEPIRDTRLGFYTYLYRYLYSGGDKPVIVGRLEELREELLPMLASVGQPVDADMRRFIEDEAPGGSTRDAAYTAHFAPEIRDLVAERDAEIIARHGYRFGA
jgi:hypothetical protein